jgi:arylsulfatase A-like enzyme
MILNVLKEHGLDNNTLVIFMGDNGEALLRGKGTLYRRGIHVPLLFRWPGRVAPGTVSDVLVSGVDLAPTILSAAGLDTDPGMNGINFLPALLGQPFNEREHVFSERGWHYGPITRTDGFDLSRSIITERYHLIYNTIPERGYTPVDMARNNIAWDAIVKAGQKGTISPLHERLLLQVPRPVFELYDLVKDPFELNNLAGQESVKAIEDELRSQLDRWMIRESDYLPLPTHVYELIER